ncbi:MAG TPA: SDR family NAD(P)-dependent oxidoreductase [Patescibacteria group bacterium]|nr:SDR family NAD(P)-dependent oxidoreductase [Patescibacteria group bacterium]
MNNNIVITGCSSGLGRYLAEKLAKQGNTVFAGVRSNEDVLFLERLWQKEKLSIYPILLDVTNETQCKNAIRKILQKEKDIDILINNAGITISKPAMESSIGNLQKLLEVNLVGAFRMMKEIIPVMIDNGKGKIINITSLNGLISLPNFALYSASKFALQALSNGMKYEIQKENIWITTLAPGAIKNEQITKEKKLPHMPLRKKFLLARIFMPMLTYNSILKKIDNVIASENPPETIILGADAYITILLKRFLPGFLWERIMFYIWSK